MMLVGQYVTYKSALDYLDSDIPLYVAISELDYETMVLHPLGQHILHHTLNSTLSIW